MQIPPLTHLGQAAWQLQLAHPNSQHWSDAAALSLATELANLAAQLQRAEQLLLVASLAERAAGV